MKSVCFQCHKNPCDCPEPKYPFESAPTNESKMPEVIYVTAPFELKDRGVWQSTPTEATGAITYHRDDKVQELKSMLRFIVEFVEKEHHFRTQDKWEALTKASNLLK